MSLVNDHPNALAGAVGGAGGGSIVLALAGLAGIHLDAYEAGLIFAACSTIVLFIGRNGFAGLLSLLEHGNKPTPPTPPPVAPEK